MPSRAPIGWLIGLAVFVGGSAGCHPPRSSPAVATRPLPSRALALTTGFFASARLEHVLVAVQEDMRFRLRLMELTPEGWIRRWQINWGEPPSLLLPLPRGKPQGLQSVLVGSGTRLSWLTPDPQNRRWLQQHEWTFNSPVLRAGSGDFDRDGSLDLLVLLSGAVREAVDMPPVPELWLVPGNPARKPYALPIRGVPWKAVPVRGILSSDLSVGILVQLPSDNGPRLHLALYEPGGVNEQQWALEWEGGISSRPVRDFLFGQLFPPLGPSLVTLEEEAPSLQRLLVYRWDQVGFLPQWQSDAPRQIRQFEVADADGDASEEVLLVEEIGGERAKFLIYTSAGDQCMVRFVSDALAGVQQATWGDVDGDQVREIIYYDDHNGLSLLEWIP